MENQWSKDIELQARKLHVLASIAMGGGFALFGLASFFINTYEMWLHTTMLRMVVLAVIIPTALLTHYRRIHVNILGYVNIVSMSVFLSYLFSSTGAKHPDRLVIDIFIFFIASAYSVIWHWKNTIFAALLFLAFHLPVSLSQMSWADFVEYNGIWTITSPLSMALIVYYRFNFIRREIELRHQLMEQNEQINQQKEELITQNHTINVQRNQLNKTYQQLTDSIRYAKRIQDALLPSTTFLEQYFNESFIYFKPRDIVSGDFYWFSEKEDKIMMIVADCTGHGIPGAFMSMVGDSALNHIIHDLEIHSPEMILMQLHQRVRTTLRQDQNQSRDGMDIVILNLYKNNQEKQYTYAEYAGAMNPIFYVQAGELKEIKGTKKAIGGRDYQNQETYQKHRIELDQPTVFYLFSDGFQDQFGGQEAEAKKFTIRQFRQLMHDISSLPLHEQHNRLGKVYEEWTNYGEYSQIDDILIVGLKV